MVARDETTMYAILMVIKRCSITTATGDNYYGQVFPKYALHPITALDLVEILQELKKF